MAEGSVLGFFHDDKGNRSMTRLLAFVGLFVGGGIAAGGLAIKMPAAVIAGCSLAAGGGVLKGVQKKFEKDREVAETTAGGNA